MYAFAISFNTVLEVPARKIKQERKRFLKIQIGKKEVK